MGINSKDAQISRIILIKIFREFKSKPLKTFVKKDFKRTCSFSRIERYLHALEKLGIIEEVDAWVQYKNYVQKRRLKGYRLIKEVKGGN